MAETLEKGQLLRHEDTLYRFDRHNSLKHNIWYVTNVLTGEARILYEDDLPGVEIL